ncbi:MAG: hypothetical protein GWQ08_21845 [Verrucomicrobiaceae bacterium]|nr:hypothetical protein [Verrucomicrobiaceae bacterium]
MVEATVHVLKVAGCRVHVPEDQTCCGQPPFNGGHFESSRRIAQHTAKVLTKISLSLFYPAPFVAFLLVSSLAGRGDRKILRSGAFFVEKLERMTCLFSIFQLPFMACDFLVYVSEPF